MSVNGCHYRVTLGHAFPLEKVNNVLSLGQKQPLRRASDGDVEEAMQILKVCHGKLGGEVPDDVLEEVR